MFITINLSVHVTMIILSIMNTKRADLYVYATLTTENDSKSEFMF